jgi:hypothetical protein
MADDVTRVDYQDGVGFEWRVSGLRFFPGSGSSVPFLWFWHAARDGEVRYSGISFRRKTAERKAKLYRDWLILLAPYEPDPQISQGQ